MSGKPKPKAEKKAEKPRLPGSVVQAVKENLRVEDLKLLLESSQSQFPDSPLLWLRFADSHHSVNLMEHLKKISEVGLPLFRDAAAYLNLRLVTAGDRDKIYDVSKSYQAGKEEFRRSESEDSVAST